MSLTAPPRRLQANPKKQRLANCQPQGWTAFETTLGWMGIVYDEGKLQWVEFGHASFEHLVRGLEARGLDLAAAEDTPAGWAQQCVKGLKQVAAGEPHSFDAIPLSLVHLTPFGERVLNACRQIEWGHVLTYRELAAKAGSPNAARAIGNVMSNNRFPLVVPCHRVVGSGGGLGGYSAPGGVATKLQLLEREGYRPR